MLTGDRRQVTVALGSSLDGALASCHCDPVGCKHGVLAEHPRKTVAPASQNFLLLAAEELTSYHVTVCTVTGDEVNTQACFLCYP